MSNRLVYLDSLRGLAAIAVLMGHYFVSYGFPDFIQSIRATPLAIFIHGEGAVALFFVLSGFVLSKSFLSKPERLNEITFLGYAVKRFFRIYPLFIFGLLVSFLLVHFIPQSIITIPAETISGERLWGATYSFKRLVLESNLLVRIPADGGLRLLPQDWTLTLELLISVFIPFFTIILKKRPFSFITLGLFMLFFKLINTYFFGFYLGMLMAFFQSHLQIFFAKKKGVKVLLLLLGIALNTSKLWMTDSSHYVLEYFVFDPTTFGGGLIILVLLTAERFQKVLTVKPIAFLGEISYGVYLVHYFVLLGIMPLFFQLLNDMGFLNEGTNKLFGLIFLLVVSIVISSLTYKFIEKPFIRLGKFFAEKFDEIANKTRRKLISFANFESEDTK